MDVYQCAYTRQKTQKRKRWKDGWIKVIRARKKLVLFDGQNENWQEVVSTGRELDELFVTDLQSINEEYEFEKFLVEMGDLMTNHVNENGNDDKENDAEKENVKGKNDAFRGRKWNSKKEGKEGPRSKSIPSSNSSSDPTLLAMEIKESRQPRDEIKSNDSDDQDEEVIFEQRDEDGFPKLLPPLSTDELIEIFDFNNFRKQDTMMLLPKQAGDGENDSGKEQQKLVEEDEKEEEEEEEEDNLPEISNGFMKASVLTKRKFKAPAQIKRPVNTQSSSMSQQNYNKLNTNTNKFHDERSNAHIFGALRFLKPKVGPDRQIRLRKPDLSNETKEQYMKIYQDTQIQALIEEIQIKINSAGFNKSRYHNTNCTMYRKTPKKRNTTKRIRKKRKRPGQYLQLSDDEGEIIGSNDKFERYFLTSNLLATNSEARKACRFGDIWFIASKEFDGKNEKVNETIWLFHSVWHSASNDGVVEVLPLSDNFRRSAISNSWNHKTRVSALHGINIEHEIEMARTMYNFLDLKLVPLLDSICFPQQQINEEEQQVGGSHQSPPPKLEDLFGSLPTMNSDQREVCEKIVKWMVGFNQAKDPICLVHGVFGAGKTKTIVNSVMLLLTLLEEMNVPQDFKICIASATNNAVDNILKHLVQKGVQVGRVGSIKRVDRQILEYVLHLSDAGFAQAVSDAKHQLKDIIHDPVAQKVLRNLESKPINRLECDQLEKIESCKVIGMTCCSSSKMHVSELFNKTKTILIMDEASQAVEPLTMMTIARTHSDYLVLVGDPLQLPPVCASRPSITPPAYADFGTPMFERLVNLGRKPIMLKKQYRCHPEIGELSSRLFYKSMLENGITQQDRSPLVQGLPPLSFFDVFHGEEEQINAMSFVNAAEKMLATQLVRRFLDAGFTSDQMCVIALYRSQAFAIANSLQDTGVAVSTVDAFQGSERDIVIISTCRTTDPGFTDSPKRVNVMLTRAKFHVIFLGNRQCLVRSSLWNQIVQGCNSNLALEGLFEELGKTGIKN